MEITVCLALCMSSLPLGSSLERSTHMQSVILNCQGSKIYYLYRHIFKSQEAFEKDQ